MIKVKSKMQSVLRHSEALDEESYCLKRSFAKLRMTIRGQDVKMRRTFHLPFTIFHSLRPAFTLAEVLITLGIIGTIAALTIPTLVKEYQKQQTVTQLQKVYSTINQAIKMSELENGSISTWPIPAANIDEYNNWWNTYIIPYFSVIQNCGSTVSPCLSQKFTYLDATEISWSTGYTNILLKDGVGVHTGAIDSNEADIYFDLNASKRPNIMGKDIFMITILYPQGKTTFYGQNLNFTRDYILGNHDASCNKSSGNLKGRTCGLLIQMDGWKISDDYPW